MAFNIRHLTTAFCRRGAVRGRRCLAEEEARAWGKEEITAYGIPLSLVTSVKYLGRFILVSYENWPAMVNNLRKFLHK